MRLVVVAGALIVGLARVAGATVDATGVFAVTGLPDVPAMSLRQTGTTLSMCLAESAGIVPVATGTIDSDTGAFELNSALPSGQPGGLGAYCYISFTGTVAPDGSSLVGTQVDYSTCVPPPLTCVPQCLASATFPFTAARTSTTPAPCCGDGVLDAGYEQCDDGNASAGDCCTATCAAEPPGGPCPSNDPCRAGSCNGFGQCEYADACTDRPVFGKRLRLERRGTREKLVWVVRDPTLDVPAAGSADDPSVVGATLELFAPNEPSVAMPLPAGLDDPGWRVRIGTRTTYRFRNRLAPLGGSPVRVTVLQSGALKIVARNAGFPLDQPLGGVGIRLVTGSRATCSYFHVGTVVIDQPGRFEARDAAATLPSCDSGLLSAGSPSAAFL